MQNPYLEMVSGYADLMQKGRQLPLGHMPPLELPPLTPQAPNVLLFSPHPDDECIIGALPLRLRRELRLNVINVAVTQGSNKQRQAGRLEELRHACAYLGFGLVQTAPNGLEKINPQTRQDNPQHWSAAVRTVTALLAQYQPRIVFLPHANDNNSTHKGTHWLVLDALTTMPDTFSCQIVETEFWGALESPNLMVESPVQDVADLVAALTFHVGEVQRNPYHLSLPAWMQDNVRRGAELVGGQGGAAPSFAFATLYRWRTFGRGQWTLPYTGGRQLTAADNLASLLAPDQ